MTPFINILESFGDQMLDFMLFPLLVWTLIAIPVAAFLRWSKMMPPVYQYHSRIAMILALPLGIGGSVIASLIDKGAEAANSAVFIVVQNPIAISPENSESASALSSYGPHIWLGLLGILLMLGAVLYLGRMTMSFIRLKRTVQHLEFHPLSSYSELLAQLPSLDDRSKNTQIAYSKNAAVPYTYGWRNTKIVIPAHLKTDSEKRAMAVQHELMHIKHRDYLLNGMIVCIKAVFWFHPLVHYLHNSSQEYREITCDGKVLASRHFSKKRYASLLYELAKREHQTSLAMSMAVNSSSLKKRIQIMSSQTNISSKFRSSIIMTIASALLIVLTISCTDMADDGITKSELNKTQAEMFEKPSGMEPLYIVNGEQWNNDKSSKKKIAKLKSKYIESIDVLKGKKATKKYGEPGKNGAMVVSVNNPDKAFTDLKTEEELKEQKSQEQQDDYFVAVEEMPKLKGGLRGLQKKISYPKMAQKAGIEGKVIVQFIVNKQGDVEDPQVIRGIGGGADEEALRVVKQAEFTPGIQKGKPVPVQYSLPFTYRLPSDKSGE